MAQEKFGMSILVHAFILFLRSIAPISCAVVGYYTYTAQLPETQFQWILFIYAASETFFLLAIYVPLRAYLQLPVLHPKPLADAERHILWQRVLENMPCAETFLRKWFLNSPLEHIKRENVKDFLSWGFWNARGSESVPAEDLDHFLLPLEQRLGRRLEDGRGEAKSFRVTFDQVTTAHRPLAWFLLLGVLDHISAFALWRSGYSFRRERFWQVFITFPWRAWAFWSRKQSAAPDIPYWYKPHTSKTSLPVLFIHGIGVGLFQYRKFLNQLSTLASNSLDDGDGEIGVVCLQLLAISSRITKPLPHNEAICAQVLAILDHHGWQKVALVGNSYGTMLCSRMLRSPSIASRIGPVFFIDPVVFLLHQPDIAYNFVARPPGSTMEHVISYFAAKDPLVAHSLSRRVFWTETILWKDELKGRNATVAIASNDIFVDAPAVKEYLLSMGTKKDGGGGGDGDGDGEEQWGGNEAWKGQGLEVLWFEGLDHAEMFDGQDDITVLLKVIKKYAMDVEKRSPNGNIRSSGDTNGSARLRLASKRVQWV